MSLMGARFPDSLGGIVGTRAVPVSSQTSVYFNANPNHETDFTGSTVSPYGHQKKKEPNEDNKISACQAELSGVQ